VTSASNCLLGDGRIRVIDWEGGVGTRTPTADLVIFLTHYVPAQPTHRNRLPDHEDAFRAALLDDGWLASLTGATFRAQLGRLGVPPEAEEYLFVAALAELACGQARTAHGLAQRYWARLLAIYAAGHERSWLGEVSRRPPPG
jgi:hypothetical protein